MNIIRCRIAPLQAEQMIRLLFANLPKMPCRLPQLKFSLEGFTPPAEASESGLLRSGTDTGLGSMAFGSAYPRA